MPCRTSWCFLQQQNGGKMANKRSAKKRSYRRVSRKGVPEEGTEWHEKTLVSLLSSRKLIEWERGYNKVQYCAAITEIVSEECLANITSLPSPGAFVRLRLTD